MELQCWRLEEEKKSEDTADGEKNNGKGNFGAEEAARRIAMLEADKRLSAEMKSLKEESGMMASAQSVVRYRKYTIDEIEAATESFAESRKIGEGGYGPVFKCNLDHTQVSVKVLRPDAAQHMDGHSSNKRHPNLVLLLGACPEYGCLVYEYMTRGSLEDCLLHRGKSPPLSWQLRFRIAAEIATGLHFLHQTKPEPLVHRNLKPANILLDQNFVSKMSDVGLARLVPPSVADSVTQYRMTSTAVTFCYIDPEYQQTGMLGVKSLGILLLQLITAKPPMGLALHVSLAIESRKFAEMLDPLGPNWPVEEALCLAKLAVQCAELRRIDRPYLGKVVLPELARLKELADESMMQYMFYPGTAPPPSHSQPSQEVFRDPLLGNNTASSSRAPSANSTPRAGHSDPAS
ncbi:U-box domain-containing protein [Drosera capensis]